MSCPRASYVNVWERRRERGADRARQRAAFGGLPDRRERARGGGVRATLPRLPRAPCQSTAPVEQDPEPELLNEDVRDHRRRQQPAPEELLRLRRRDDQGPGLPTVRVDLLLDDETKPFQSRRPRRFRRRPLGGGPSSDSTSASADEGSRGRAPAAGRGQRSVYKRLSSRRRALDVLPHALGDPDSGERLAASSEGALRRRARARAPAVRRRRTSAHAWARTPTGTARSFIPCPGAWST